MKIALIGFGKMGKTIERIAISRGHEIVAKFSLENPINLAELKLADVAIEFTAPQFAVDHISTCLKASIPVIVGTTGWNEQLEFVKTETFKRNGSVLYASNFSLGVNLYFAMVQKMAKLMNGQNYNASIEEIHHLQKLDAPSGTAITTAEKLLQNQSHYASWKLIDTENITLSQNQLPIFAHRLPDVPGTHHVHYDSACDKITLTHEAKNRDGFALGSIIAAEWLQHKKGIFTMSDVLNIQ